MKRIIYAGAALALLAAAPAAANETDFFDCDGFKVPTAAADGTASSWGGMYPLAGDADEASKKAAVASCDAALADPLLQPQFALRRFLLLRSKALYQIALKQGAEAKATLDQAEAVRARLAPGALGGQADAGLALIRAYADYLRGDAVAARAALDAIEKANPYSTQTAALAFGMRATFDPDTAAVRRAMLARVPTDPAVLNQVFWLALYYDDFAEGVRLGPQVSFELPRGRGDSHITGIENRKYEVVSYRAEYAGATAYALAATGQADAARAAIAQGRKDAVTATATADPSVKRNAGDQFADRNQRNWALEAANKKLDLWERAIALRAQAPTMTAEEFIAVKEVKDLPVTIDLLRQLRLKSPAEQAILRQTIDKLAARRDTEMRELGKIDLSAFANLLPRPGAARGTPKFRSAGIGILFDDSNGFYVKQEPRSPYVAVRYGDKYAPKWAIEELTLLAAANAARKAGKDSFLIDTRMMIDRTITTTQYGRTLGTSSNGAELRYRILPVNAAELPAEMESRRWRLIRAQAVIDALGAKYQPPAGSKR